MIRVNLLPVKELKAEVSRRREIMIGACCLAATVVVIGGLYLYQLRRTSLAERELADLRRELQGLNIKAKDVADLQDKIKGYENKQNVLESINKKKSGPLRIMESLSAATPSTLWLTQFKESGGNVTITGLAVDNQTIADFLKALESYPFFREPELVETIQSDQTGTPPRRFAIRSKLLYQPPAQAGAGNKAESKPAATKANPS